MIPAEMLGTILKDTYRITKPLGSGGMGTVFVAEHLKLPRKFAVKFINKVQQESPELLKRFEREATIASGLGHPNIVDVVDFDAVVKLVPEPGQQPLEKPDRRIGEVGGDLHGVNPRALLRLGQRNAVGVGLAPDRAAH